MNVDTHSYLAGSDFIDIQAFARNRADHLYYAVRDDIRYDPYKIPLDPTLFAPEQP